MTVLKQALSAPWQYYLDRAIEADTSQADHFGAGREEQLWETLKVIETGEIFDDACRCRLDRIPQNRAKKHLRLLQAYVNYAKVAVTSHEFQVDLRDEVEFVERVLTAQELQIEHRLAMGDQYADIAVDISMSPVTLKVRVSRCRKRVRMQLLRRAG